MRKYKDRERQRFIYTGKCVFGKHKVQEIKYGQNIKFVWTSIGNFIQSSTGIQCIFNIPCPN